MCKININLIEELNLIQTQIQRMANNSFIIKGWYVTIQLALIAYLFKEVVFGVKWLVLLVPFLICSLYDTYFLRLERIYRKKYEWNIDKINNVNIKDRLELNPKKILTIIENNGDKVDSVLSLYLKEIIPFLDNKSEILLFKIYVLPVLILVIIA
ncbi:hypothetical protein [Cetobacterium sp.]|uniref:hypothetical protein n=1 Tax=Cetobacterium sp. TaxID=2071632 RepID=UPI003F3D5FDC